MPIRTPVCVQSANAILGEGPNWHPTERALYWVDIKRLAVFRFEPGIGQTGHWPMPLAVGCAAPARTPGQLVFADAAGFGLLDLHKGGLTRIANPESEFPGNRFNDGKVDRAGRFWAGSMHDRCEWPTGSLYRLDTDHSVHRMAGGFICSNGMGWSPDDRLMYFTDSMLRTLWTYEFDPLTGALGQRREFAQLSADDGVFDGLTVDSEGYVWVAVWDGWRVIRYAPDGSIDREVRFPVQRPTSCMFGGHDLRTLYVTSACVELSLKNLSTGPLAGALFALECEVPGLPETQYAG